VGEHVGRGRRVVCRTQRGLEVGVVLREPDANTPVGPVDGTLLRRVTPEDELLLARLERDRDQAFVDCTELLRQRQLDVTLVDVEHLFDGSTLLFYYLGEVSSQVNALTQELAERYAATVKFHEFAATLQHGCGPDCGTTAAGSCGDECSGCAVAAACRSSS
jgi:cell fate regulator YaaT (PSP1 superfamily)